MAAVPFKVKAVYDYASQEADDLSFPVGQIITVTEEIDADWYEGEYTDVTGNKKAGIFPNNFVEKYEPEVPSRPSRPARPAKEAQLITSPVVEPSTKEVEEDKDLEEPPAIPAQSKPASQPDKTIDPAASRPVPITKAVETAQTTKAVETATTESKKPPPVVPKSNTFKDRIAAFNTTAAAPILPFVPGQRSQPSTFIKKPFVAPPPSKDAYVPPPKQETVQKAYVREEDPEIKQRQEDDLAAAQSAGLISNEGSDSVEDTPKPQSLKDRIAMLQKQQMEQAQRRADGVTREKKLPPPRQDEENEEEQMPEAIERTSLDERPRIPTMPRQERELNDPPVPQHEILSGGEEADQSAAGETTEDDVGTIGHDESDERPMVSRETEEEDEEEGLQAADEDDMDEDTRRKLELRERMAKMSGGMGMAGMFGPPGGMPMPGMSSAKRVLPTREKRSTDDAPPSSPPVPQGRVPMVPVSGLQSVMSPEAEEIYNDDDDDRFVRQQSLDNPRRSMHETRGLPPPVPQDRAVPPPPNSRPTLPPTPPVLHPESEEDEEEEQLTAAAETPRIETPIPTRGAAPALPRVVAQDNRASYFGSESSIATLPTAKTSSQPTGTNRAPPPPPPPPAAQDTEDDRGESEYEGDYDTDIASSAKRKDALKSHTRELSFDDSTTADGSPLSSPVPTRALPPLPAASRAAPPPPPPTQARSTRQSTDLPRVPPPLPPTPSARQDDEDYDPYRYSGQAASQSVPPVPQRPEEEDAEESSDDLYSAPAPRKSLERSPPTIAPQDRVPPPPPPTALSPPPRAPPRQSLDIQQTPALGRRSTEQSRSTAEHGQIASDLDLDQTSTWWTAAEPLPPVLQGRNGVDLIYECEESSTSKRGGRTTISKDIYVLYLDYSQTIITARYDSREPADVTFEQRHEPTPAKLRQDQLENYWNRFGRSIAEAANNLGNAKKDTTVGDGSSASLVYELIKSQPEALLPVGTRAYGALVYGNLANASVMQFDEIRAGDIVTLRNAKFEGKHSGPMHQKYKQELGASHVAIVNEWDGTKKKIRVWEQGREKKNGLKAESYRLGDLKSGEVRVWRVVGREWVGWESNA